MKTQQFKEQGETYLRQKAEQAQRLWGSYKLGVLGGTKIRPLF